jgi:hypothetical protein
MWNKMDFLLSRATYVQVLAFVLDLRTRTALRSILSSKISATIDIVERLALALAPPTRKAHRAPTDTSALFTS